MSIVLMIVNNNRLQEKRSGRFYFFEKKKRVVQKVTVFRGYSEKYNGRNQYESIESNGIT